MSVEARIAATLDKFLTYDNFVNDDLLPQRMAAAVVAELGLTQTEQYGVRCDDGTIYTAINMHDAARWGKPAVEVVQRTLLQSMSPWCASPSSPEGESNE